MRLVYFARVREALGSEGEDMEFPPNVQTVGAALDLLANQSPRHAEAFADRTKLRFALDQHMVKADASIVGADELAIFPPVTGG